MSLKDMKRSNWPRVLKKDYIARDMQFDDLRGQISLSILRELTGPLTVSYPFGDVRIADTDYSWLQIALEDQYVWVTAMYDSRDRMVNLYFDITAGNRFDDPENPCFEDMYLDIAIAGENMAVLDQDELDEALEKGDISQAEHEHAEKICTELFAYLRENKTNVIEWCDRSFEEMKRLFRE